jgi:hypothetical protein
VRASLGIGGVGVLAVVCCAGLPLLATAGLSAAAYALVGGVAAGVVALVLLALFARVRRRRACAAPTIGGTPRRS